MRENRNFRAAGGAACRPHPHRFQGDAHRVFAAHVGRARANVSNMMLARALARQREIAIRVSLGAGRTRLVRQLLIESLLLAFPAAAGGIAISSGTLRLGTWLLFRTLPPSLVWSVKFPSIETDWRVCAFVLLAAVCAALVASLRPAQRAVAVDPLSALHCD